MKNNLDQSLSVQVFMKGIEQSYYYEDPGYYKDNYKISCR